MDKNQKRIPAIKLIGLSQPGAASVTAFTPAVMKIMLDGFNLNLVTTLAQMSVAQPAQNA